MEKKRVPPSELEKKILGDLLDMCWDCEWLTQNKCPGIAKEDVETTVVLISAPGFAVITEISSIPMCPRLVRQDPERN